MNTVRNYKNHKETGKIPNKWAIIPKHPFNQACSSKNGQLWQTVTSLTTNNPTNLPTDHPTNQTQPVLEQLTYKQHQDDHRHHGPHYGGGGGGLGVSGGEHHLGRDNMNEDVEMMERC